MRKLLIVLMSFLFVSCVSISNSKLKGGNYIDRSFSHTIIVTKTTPLVEFGITTEEWEKSFNDSLLYKAYGKGNAFMSESEVKNFTLDAIRLTARNKQKHFIAIVEGQSGSNTLYLGQSYNIGSVTTHSLSPVEKYDFSCLAIMFDNEDLIPGLREAFGRIQIVK
jgi:hypothetical protein